MQIFILKGQERTGPFSLEEIVQKVNRGECTPSSKAWHEGLTEWKRLDELGLVVFPGSEYQRTCLRCGKVWHSLVSREAKLIKDHQCNLCVTATQCGSPTVLAGQRLVQAGESEIARLRKCPECQSTNYSEKILSPGG